jgi:hypothetical protein
VISDKLKQVVFTESVFENPGSSLCGFGFSFPAPLRERLFLAKAQSKNVRRKGLNQCLA